MYPALLPVQIHEAHWFSWEPLDEARQTISSFFRRPTNSSTGMRMKRMEVPRRSMPSLIPVFFSPPHFLLLGKRSNTFVSLIAWQTIERYQRVCIYWMRVVVHFPCPTAWKTPLHLCECLLVWWNGCSMMALPLYPLVTIINDHYLWWENTKKCVRRVQSIGRQKEWEIEPEEKRRDDGNKK